MRTVRVRTPINVEVDVEKLARKVMDDVICTIVDYFGDVNNSSYEHSGREMYEIELEYEQDTNDSVDFETEYDFTSVDLQRYLDENLPYYIRKLVDVTLSVADYDETFEDYDPSEDLDDDYT